MSSRIIHAIWRCNGLSVIRTLSSKVGRGYATPFGRRLVFPKQEFHRDYTVAAAIKESPQNADQSLNRLQTDFATFGSVSPGNFRKVLESLDAGGSIPFEQSIFLLEACADLMPSQNVESRMQFFTKLWDYLKVNGKLKKQHFITFLNVHAANGAPIEDFRKFLQENNLTEDPDIYEKLIQHSCELGNIKLSTEILAEMRTKGFALSENIFNALILGHSKNKDLKGALEVFETMNAAGIKLSPSTHAQLIGAYIENDEMDKALEILQQYSGQFNPNQILKLIKTVINSSQKDKKKLIKLLVNEFPADFLNVQEVPPLIRNYCTELIHRGHIDEATTIIDVLPSPKFNDNQDIDTFGVTFIQDLLRSKTSHDRIVEIVKNLIESGKNSRALHVACYCAMHRNPELVYTFFKALSETEPLRPHYFWPLILYRFRRNGEAGVLSSLKMMSNLGVVCDFQTLSFYVLPRLYITLDDTQQAIKMLEDCGLKTSQTLTPIMVHLIFQQKLEDIIKISQLYTSKLDTQQFIQPLANQIASIRATRRYQKYTSSIHNLSLKSENSKFDFVGQVLLEIIGNNKVRNDYAMLSRIISDLNRLGSKVSPGAIEILNGHLAKAKNEKVDTNAIQKILSTMIDRTLSLPLSDKTGSHIAHPRDMSYEELECHLVELQAKGMNTRGVLRRLLQVCVRDGRLERAQEVKKKCEEAQVEMSPGMLASILEMYVKIGDYPAAEAAYNHILRTYPGFLLDEHKLIDFAALTVQQNKLEEAKQLLSDRLASRKIFGGDYVIKNVWNFLTSVARLASQQTDLPKEKNLTKEVFFFIRKLGYCNAHNAVLGPIIREYLYRKDIRSAVAEFKKLAETFRHTPLQFELSSILVSLSNKEDPDKFDISKDEAKELLQELTTTVSSIHGPINMNSSLLLAVAESGTENQLRKLLINTEFRINHDMLAQNCEHLSKEGSVETLMRLAKACRGLGHVVKEQDVYDMLLKKFVSEYNYEAALQLFERLEADDDLKMSQDFLKNLVNLFKVNKVEIPSSLALRAQVI